MQSARADQQIEPEPLKQEALYILEEARMVLPGIQALLGFQLIAAFNQRFTNLSPVDQVIHLAALVLTAVSVAVIMTPAAYHRQAARGQLSRYFIRKASQL